MPKAASFSARPNAIAPERSPSNRNPLKLHLGCGDQRLEGYVNCDLYKTPATDKTFDCQGPWPFPDQSISHIYASHMLEHLPNFKAFFMEAHRVLRPDGNLQIRVPYGGHRAAYWDIEHVRPWYAETFCFLQPGYGKSIRNAQHVGWQHFFSIEDCVLRVEDQLAPLLKWRWLRRRILPWLHFIPEAIAELWIYLIPLKTDQAVNEWLQLREGNAFGARYSMYVHQLEGRDMRTDEPLTFADWRDDL